MSLTAGLFNSGLFKGGLFNGGLFKNIYEWSPASLFSAGEQGAWYDPSDLSTLFQDAAGTTPVTTTGQSVRKILDKSGNGNHATAPSDAARPVLQIDGNGKYYLYFDGVDDCLTTTLFNLGSSYSMHVGWSVDLVTTGDRTLFAQRSKVSPNPMRASLDISAANHRFYDRNDAGTVVTGLVYSVSADTKYVTTAQSKPEEQILRVDGVLRSSQSKTLGVTTLTDNSIGRAEVAAPVSYFKGKLYGMILRSAYSTSKEILKVEAYIADKIGVVLS